MPAPALAFTDSMGYVDQEAFDASPWETVHGGGGRVQVSWGVIQTVDGQSPVGKIVLNGWNLPGTDQFMIRRSFLMEPNSLVGISLHDLRIGTPWFEGIEIRLVTPIQTAIGAPIPEGGMITALTDATGLATAYIIKSTGYPYEHSNEQYFFANFRLYGTLVDPTPPEGAPPTEEPLLLFTPEINWQQALVEELEFETTITPSWGQIEQREALMDTPNRKLSFLVTPSDAREAGLLEALIYAGQVRHWWVPYWRSVLWLPAAKAIGATTLAFDTRYLGYEEGQGVMFWKDPYTAEVAIIEGVTDGGLVFSPLMAAWSATPGVNRTRIMPAFEGLMAPSLDLDYIERSMKSSVVTFDLLS